MAALVGAAHAQAGAASGPDAPVARVGVLLRAGASSADARVELARELRRAPTCAFEILASGRLPPLEEAEEGPLLRPSQEELLLDGLVEAGPRRVLAELWTWQEARESETSALSAAMLVLGAAGDQADIPRLFRLAEQCAAEGGDPRPFERAVGRMLRRDRGSLQVAWQEAREASAEVLEPVLRALGATRDPRVLDLLGQAARLYPDLDQLVVAQVRLIPAPREASQGAGLADWLRSELDDASSQRCRAAALALGQMEDAAAAPRLVELLGREEQGVREAAHWALQRIARTRLPPDPSRWERWLAGEELWWRTESEAALAGLRSSEDEAFARSLRAVLAHPLHRHALAEELVDMLADASGARAVRLAQALGQLGSPRGIGALLGLFGDIEDDLALAAHGALRAITGKDLPMRREAWKEVAGDLAF